MGGIIAIVISCLFVSNIILTEVFCCKNSIKSSKTRTVSSFIFLYMLSSPEHPQRPLSQTFRLTAENLRAMNYPVDRNEDPDALVPRSVISH